MKKSELDFKEKEIPVMVSVLKDEEIQGEPEGEPGGSFTCDAS